VAAVWCGGTWDYQPWEDQFQLARLDKTGPTAAETATLSLVRNAGTTPTLTVESGKSLTGHPLTGTLRYEVEGFDVRIYID
jgi:hypothetical protein